MKIGNVAITGDTLASNEYGIVNNRSVKQSEHLSTLDRLLNIAVATAPLAIVGVAFQDHLVYLLPAIPFLAVAFIYLLLRGISGTTSLKA